MVAAAIAATAAVSAAASIGSSAMSSSAAGAAAGKESAASQLGIEAQQSMYKQNSSLLSPYINSGSNDFNLYQQYLPMMMQETQMPSVAQLQATPGYQFELQNGLNAAQNSAAARGLGVSGAAMKAASTYATGLADSTWQDVYKSQLAGQQAQSNLLLGGAQVGLNAANTLSGAGQSSANAQQAGYTNMGQAQAAGIVGSANAIGGGLTSATGSLSSAAMYNSLMQNQGFPNATNVTGGNTAAGLWYEG